MADHDELNKTKCYKVGGVCTPDTCFCRNNVPPAQPVAQMSGDALGYAKRLATAIWEKHYRNEAPGWKPFDDLAGVLTQIDNMTCRLGLATSHPSNAVQDAPKITRENIDRAAYFAIETMILPAEQWEEAGLYDFAHAITGGIPVVDDLSALVRKLVRALSKAAPDNDLCNRSLDYLKRHGLSGNILRTESESAAPVPQVVQAPIGYIQSATLERVKSGKNVNSSVNMYLTKTEFEDTAVYAAPIVATVPSDEDVIELAGDFIFDAVGKTNLLRFARAIERAVREAREETAGRWVHSLTDENFKVMP